MAEAEPEELDHGVYVPAPMHGSLDVLAEGVEEVGNKLGCGWGWLGHERNKNTQSRAAQALFLLTRLR